MSELVRVLDQFCVSMDAYHEITQLQVGAQLPRSYVVEGCVKHHSEQLSHTIKRTPGVAPGAELPLKPLLEKEVRKYVSFMTRCSKSARSKQYQYLY
mgnify:CR=1 FL=1